MDLVSLPMSVSWSDDVTLRPLPLRRSIDLKQSHLELGLDPDDLRYLDAAPIVPRSYGQTFRGVSIEP